MKTLTLVNIAEMQKITSIEEMDKYLEELNNEKLSKYWSWAKKTEEWDIDTYIDVYRDNSATICQAVLLLLELIKNVKFKK